MTCREEILACATELAQHIGEDHFTVQEILVGLTQLSMYGRIEVPYAVSPSG